MLSVMYPIIEVTMKLLDMFMDMLYPRHLTCVLCHDESDGELCKKCLGSIQFNIGPICLSCGRMIMKNDYLICHQCKTFERHYDRGISVGVYDDFMSKLLFDLKYNDKKYIARMMASYMVEYIIKLDLEIEFDFIVPVPLHKDRLKKRGFNQTELIGQFMSDMTGVPQNTDLVRMKPTKPLSTLSADERLEILNDAFELKSPILGNVILVDDIFTTGSTLNTCAKELKSCGTSYILGVTFAVGE